MIAALQYCSTDKPVRNLEVIERLVKRAVLQEAKLIVLPENALFMGNSLQSQVAHAEPLGQGVLQDSLSKLAKNYSVWLLVGSLPIKDKKSLYSASLLWNSHGECVARYNKIHLFDVSLPSVEESYQESAVFRAGQEILVVETPIGHLGMSICYDIRFPEMYRKMVEMGAEVFAVPAAFTTHTGEAHWHVLLRARAIENQCYLIAAGQTGVHSSGRETYGHSCIIDPWGRVVTEQTEGEGVVVSDIDLRKLHQLRKDFPTLKHRKIKH